MAVESSVSDCILARLRNETASHHQNIENSIPVMKDSLTKEEYIEILKRFHRFHSDFENQLSKHPSLNQFVPDLSQRLKLDLLEKDLRFFSVSTDERSAAAPSVLPAAGQSIASALGALYVMEGSTLGGQVISRHLKDQLGIDAENGAAYYNAYGPTTGKMWQAFKNVLKAQLQSEKDRSEAIEAAQATFTALQSQMSKELS